jgi:hypothetical protein
VWIEGQARPQIIEALTVGHSGCFSDDHVEDYGVDLINGWEGLRAQTLVLRVSTSLPSPPFPRSSDLGSSTFPRARAGGRNFRYQGATLNSALVGKELD